MVLIFIEGLVKSYTSWHSHARWAFHWANFKTMLVRKDEEVETRHVQCLIFDGQLAKRSGRKYGVFACNALNGRSMWRNLWTNEILVSTFLSSC